MEKPKPMYLTTPSGLLIRARSMRELQAKLLAAYQADDLRHQVEVERAYPVTSDTGSFCGFVAVGYVRDTVAHLAKNAH